MSTATAPEILRLAVSATSAPTSANDAERTIDLIALSGAEIPRSDYSGSYTMRVEIDGIDTSRVQAGTCPFLDSHSSWSITSQLGSITRVKKSGDQLIATAKFFPSAEQAFLDSKAAKRGVSVGLIVLERKDETDTNGQLVRRVITKSQLYEISLVPVPADGGATTLAMETSSMNTITQPEQAATDAAVATLSDVDKKAIRDRVKCANLPVTFGEILIATVANPEQATEKIFAELARREREEQPETRGPVAFGFTGSHRDYYDGRFDRMVEGLTARITGKAAREGAREFAAMSAADLARECVKMSNRHHGVSYLSDARAVELGLQGTTDYPALLTETGNRVLKGGYEASESPIKQIARRSTVNDYRPKSTLQLSEAPELLKVNEAGEVKSGPMSETKETYGVVDHGRIVGLTQPALVNDDLNAFDLLRKFGTSGSAKEANVIHDVLTANSGAGPTMSDGTTLFHANHGNLGTGGAISLTTLSEARKLMRLQKDLDKKTIVGVAPKFLLVPAALETAAEQYLAELAPATASDTNPFVNKLTLLVEPRLDAKSTTRFYIFGDPGLAPVLEYSYLAGSEGVQLSSRVGFTVLGIEFRAVLTFGCGAIDWRGVVMNAGA